MKNIFIYAFSAVLFLCGCMDVRAVDKNKPLNEQKVSLTGSGLTPQLVGLEQMGKYEVVFPFYPQEFAVRKKKKSPTTTEFVFVTSALATAPLKDIHVNSGEKLVYEIGHKIGETFETLEEHEVEIPTDRIFSGEIKNNDPLMTELMSYKKWGRLKFENGTVITTEGKNLKLAAQEIYFDKTILRSYPPDSQAQSGQVGRDAGTLVIMAQKAQGHLRLELRGERGGDGLAGAAPSSSMKGQKGLRGRSGFALVENKPKTYGSLSQMAKDIVTCIERPSGGQDGGVGAKGMKGGKGARGGSSGLIELKIKDKASLTIVDVSEPGLGGRGGPGGAGGEGGDGGDAGEIKYQGTLNNDLLTLREYVNCESHGQGNKGPRGPSGDSGDAGDDGQMLTPKL